MPTESKPAVHTAKWTNVRDSLPKDLERVDVWFQVYASALSMGMSDSWREPSAYRKNGKWYHIYRGKEAELRSELLTHWIPCGEGPERPDRRDGKERRGSAVIKGGEQP